MKEIFFKFASLILVLVCSANSLVIFVVCEDINLNTVIFINIVQLLVFLSCGIIIQMLYKQANIDSLTGMCNRRYFTARSARILKSNFPISLMMIDVDNFKSINDTYRHSAGDNVLRQLAEILKRNIRSTDIVARLGGDEFAIVMYKTDSDGVMKMSERIKQEIETTSFYFDGVSVNITISIGVATSKIPIDTECLLKNADEVLYTAKQTKNSIVACK